MRSTERMILIIIVTALVAGGIGVGATLLVKDDNNSNIAVTTPFPTLSPEVTESPSPSPTLSPSPSASASPTASATSNPSATHTATPSKTSGPAPATRSATSVSCSSEPQFCSNGRGMRVSSGDLASTNSTAGGSTDPGRYPTITMHTKFEGPNGSSAGTGDKLTQIVVDVDVVNKTSNRTFVFPKRQVALVITKNGAKFDTLVTDGSGFEMPPGGKLHAHYERPFTSDGDYKWVAKTWYYQKS